MKLGTSLLEVVIYLAVGAIAAVALLNLMNLCMRDAFRVQQLHHQITSLWAALSVMQRDIARAPEAQAAWSAIASDKIAWFDEKGSLQGFWCDNHTLWKVRGRRPLVLARSIDSCSFEVKTRHKKIIAVGCKLMQGTASLSFIIPVYGGYP